MLLSPQNNKSFYTLTFALKSVYIVNMQTVSGKKLKNVNNTISVFNALFFIKNQNCILSALVSHYFYSNL